MKKLLLFSFILLMRVLVFAQTPQISYTTPQTYTIGDAITPLVPKNTGGAVPSMLSPRMSIFISPINGYAPDIFVLAPSGDIYSYGNFQIFHTKTDGTTTVFAGTSTSATIDGTGTGAGFQTVTGMVMDAAGNIYVAENNSRDVVNCRIRKITPGGVVTTYAQGLRAVGTLTIASDGTLYAVDSGNRIMKITNDGVVSLLAGQIAVGKADGVGGSASFYTITSLATDKNGNIYAGDQNNSLVRKITSQGVVSTLAGSTLGYSDGVGASAKFSYPLNVTCDSKGNIILADQYNNFLRKITPDGVVTTIGGPMLFDDQNRSTGISIPTKFVLDKNDDIICTAYANSKFYKVSLAGYSITPALPAGLTLGPDGTITGTPIVLSTANTYTVRGTNASGMSAATVNLQVVVANHAPVISSFNPVSAIPNSQITITGNYFTGATAVSIGGKPASFFTVTSPTTITAGLGAGTVSGDIIVTNPFGTTTISGFAITPPPIISSFSPISAGKGTKVTITGTNFTGVTQVLIGGSYATYNIISPTTIEATVGDAGNNGIINVYAPAGSAQAAGFTFIGLPAISSISPASAGKGATVTINGTNFSNATSVKFGGVDAGSFTVVSATKITAVLGDGATGALSITTAGGTGTYNSFTYLPPPVITQASPMKGGANTYITITGTGLDGAQVYIGNAPATVLYNYSNQILATVGSGATSGDIQVATTAGTATLPGFVFLPAPQITSFSPQTAGAGDKVIITGTNLSDASYVSFGSVYTPFVVQSPTSIEATIGNGASGSIAITTPGGSATISGFTHTGPAVTSFTPVSAGVGQTVTINGNNFTGTTEVDFGGVPATSFNVVSANQITAVVGAGTSGSVTVVTPLGKGSLAGFTHPGPSINSFSPTYAGPLSTSLITIYGSNFTGASSVTFGGVAAASFTVVSANTITAVPKNAASGDVVVTTPLGTIKSAGFTWVQAPVINSITPSTQQYGGSVTITGSNFTGLTDVSFGGVPALYYYISSLNTITATVGNGASGDVSVSTVGGTTSFSGFVYSTPVLTAISPAIAAAGQTVTITGKNLTGVQSVQFGGVNASSFTINSATSITAIVGTGASGNVSITSLTGNASISGFTYLPPPVIYSFTPTSGGNNTEVAISGANLTGTTAVSIGGIPALSITNVSNTLVKAIVGAGATGKISLTTPAGTIQQDGFTWLPAPSISSIDPATANSQTSVTITGTNFTGITQVMFGTKYGLFSVVSPTQITARPISGESGDITVIGPGGTAVYHNFTFLPAPVISSYTSSGEGSSATVTITGTNFTNVTDVSFGGVSASSFTVVSANTITAKPGIGATGLISVKADGGSASLPGFVYLAPPVINSFAPLNGPAGTVVTISGDNFNTSADKNVVFFGPVKAQIKSATKNSLVVVVPKSASGLLVVENLDKKLSAYSNLPFTLTNTTAINGFSNKLEIKFATNPGRILMDDFDNDGKADLLVAKEDSLYILRNTSDDILSRSSFKQKIDLKVGRAVTAMTSGDVDGDGKKDILFSMLYSVVYLHNTSTGGNISFELKVFENINFTNGTMSLRDMDMDGRPDLVTTDFNNASYYPNTTTNGVVSFGPLMYLTNSSSAGTISSTVTDIDGDRKPDVILGSSYTGIDIWQNNTVPGSLQSSYFTTSYYNPPSTYYFAYAMASADFDGDGKVDLLENDQTSGSFLVSRNTSVLGAANSTSFAATKSYYAGNGKMGGVIPADFNGDGKIDLVTSYNNGVYYLQNNSTTGNIQFGSPITLITGSTNVNFYDLVVNDIDGDGKTDIAVLDAYDKEVIIYHNGPIPVPQITAIKPAAAASGQKVTITGKYFDETSIVKFGSKLAASFTVLSPDSIEAVVGDGETGIVSVQNPDGVGSLAGFTFIQAPTISAANQSFNNDVVTVAITGSNFTGTTAVTVNDIAALSFTINSATSITAIFKPGLAGNLLVTNPAGTASLPIVIKDKSVINFPSISGLTYGDADVVLSGTSSNNAVPVVYTTTNAAVATILNGKLHIISAGTFDIKLSQIGDSNYYAAVDLVQTITIAKKDLQVTANDQIRAFGQNNPTFTLNYAGFVNGDNESSLSTLPTVATTAGASSTEGTYDLVPAGGGAANYNLVYKAGTLTITVAATNFKISTTSITCKGANNGMITISPVQSLNYTATLTGNGLNKTYNFSGALTIDQLAPGTYNVCITANGIANFNQCSDLVITEPKDLALYATVNKQTNMVTLSLNGGDTYNVQLNGASYATHSNSITLPLSKGSNKLSVSTDKPCQGTVEQVINTTDNQVPYPNPFNNILYVNLGDANIKTCDIKIYGFSDGKLKYSQSYTNTSGILQIAATTFASGFYSIHIIADGKESIYKIIKL